MDKKTESLHKFFAKSAKSVDPTISYQTLPSPERSGANVKDEPAGDIIGHSDGTGVALNPDMNQKVFPVSNAPALDVPDGPEIPDEYQFEIYRLRARIIELENIVRDKDDKLRHALTALEDELLFWRTGLDDRVWETLGTIFRRVQRLESAIANLKDRSPKHYPPLEVPARWTKHER